MLVRKPHAQIWLVALFIATPCALVAQVAQVLPEQCVYRLGDNLAWAAASVDPAGWKPYTEYKMTGDTTALWIRCNLRLDSNAIQHPAVLAAFHGSSEIHLFADGQSTNDINASNLSIRIYPLPGAPSRSTHTIALRIHQQLLIPGLAPHPPVFLYLGDAQYMGTLAQANQGESLRQLVPSYSAYLVIGASGLFLLGLFLFDRSQNAALWLGIYCCCVCITRLNVMIMMLTLYHYPIVIDSVLFSVAMFESWALVRVNFALAHRRIPAVYWVVFAAWVFMFVGSILPAFLPARWALLLSLFVQATCFKPVWCIWTFACTAPFVAFWPWTGLNKRLRIVAALCLFWAVIEGWFQLQQVVLNRNTWSNQVQNWMSGSVAALVVAILGYIFQQQRIAAEERAELRGELTAARQVQHVLVPEKMQVAPGITVSSAFLPAHEVGGDFYLCRALPNGAQRVLLGDVSGKGVAAALTSALLLGAADRCDHLRPPAVLGELNSALRNSGISGFTTCLCADLLPNGALIIANAGQLPPYRNGAEIEIPSGLPLGIDPVADYAESSLQLAPGDTLTLLSDGVVEARNHLGELFGFERTRQISALAAQQIAQAAVTFGQQDDITVLTLSLAPAHAIA